MLNNAIVYISKDNKRFISTVDGCPSFLRGSHLQRFKDLSLDYKEMDNVTSEFYHAGFGKSINQFLNNY